MNSHPLNEDLEGAGRSELRHHDRPESGRSRWPDDGLPPRFANEREHSPLHPYGVMGSVLGRR